MIHPNENRGAIHLARLKRTKTRKENDAPEGEAASNI